MATPDFEIATPTLDILPAFWQAADRYTSAIMDMRQGKDANLVEAAADLARLGLRVRTPEGLRPPTEEEVKHATLPQLQAVLDAFDDFDRRHASRN